MSFVQLDKEGSVFILRLCDGENRFRPEVVAEIQAALDTVEADAEATALITTGHSKFYSNGLDLEWLTTQDGDAMRDFVADLLNLFARIMSFPLPTIAAMNGHAFAGGGMLSLAHDYRVMRSDRGYFCLPEVDILIPLVHGMTALIKERITGTVLRDAVLTGKRFGAEEAVAAGFVDVAAPDESVLPGAMEIAVATGGKDRNTMAALKRGLYREALAMLQGPEAVKSP